jgi:N-acetyl-anhydromuramyl-L-alanine amidase AmpD
VLLAFALALAGCQHGQPRTFAPRKGDEIVVAGQFFHIGTPVVTWMDPGGYDAYRVERRFVPLAESGWDATRAAAPAVRTPNRYGLRQGGLTPAEIERVRGGGWDLPTLQRVVDQFVLHYDVCGISKACFDVLHDRRGLSVHFMLDVDGTIYQTLDLKERAWHATTSNDRSIGIEIANMGAYRATEKHPFARWYGRDAQGTVLTVPPELGDGAVRTPGFVGRPDRPDPVTGEIQGDTLTQYDLTPEQYEALVKLTAALCTVFPKIRCDYPRDAAGALVTRKLPDDELRAYQGVLGHFHIQANKVDPGPALQWDRVIDGARRLLGQR